MWAQRRISTRYKAESRLKHYSLFGSFWRFRGGERKREFAEFARFSGRILSWTQLRKSEFWIIVPNKAKNPKTRAAQFEELKMGQVPGNQDIGNPRWEKKRDEEEGWGPRGTDRGTMKLIPCLWEMRGYKWKKWWGGLYRRTGKGREGEEGKKGRKIVLKDEMAFNDRWLTWQHTLLQNSQTRPWMNSFFNEFFSIKQCVRRTQLKLLSGDLARKVLRLISIQLTDQPTNHTANRLNDSDSLVNYRGMPLALATRKGLECTEREDVREKRHGQGGSKWWDSLWE